MKTVMYTERKFSYIYIEVNYKKQKVFNSAVIYLSVLNIIVVEMKMSIKIKICGSLY